MQLHCFANVLLAVGCHGEQQHDGDNSDARKIVDLFMSYRI
uniref:Uncharacterized protein n=1 Tax=Arundo donax TaxID=35708 RepID=A0A0A8YTH1_ARUDO